MARAIEQAGIPTVTLNLIPQIVTVVGIPRALTVSHPFGSPVGSPHAVEQHLKVLRAALKFLVTADTPGSSWLVAAEED